ANPRHQLKNRLDQPEKWQNAPRQKWAECAATACSRRTAISQLSRRRSTAHTHAVRKIGRPSIAIPRSIRQSAPECRTSAANKTAVETLLLEQRYCQTESSLEPVTLTLLSITRQSRFPSWQTQTPATVAPLVRPA